MTFPNTELDSNSAIRTKRSASLAAARRIVEAALRYGRCGTELHGHAWVCSLLTPACRLLQRTAARSKDARLAGECWYLLGDLRFCESAPLAAVIAYRHCHRLIPSSSQPLTEIGDCFHLIGNDIAARKWYMKALRVNPFDEVALEGVRPQKQMTNGNGAIGKPGEKYWTAMEMLARCHYVNALEVVESLRNVQARRIKAMALSQQGDACGALNEWKKIARARRPVELQGADWYYLSDALWSQPDFWKVVLSMVSHFTHLGLYTSHGDVEGPPEVLASGKPTRSVYKLTIEMHLARSNCDVKQLATLSRHYPSWIAPRIAIDWWKASDGPPTRAQFTDRCFDALRRTEDK